MQRFDVAIIGAGPGGYVAAIRAAQLDLRVALIDERAAPGGTCLHVGCIPSKALLESSDHFALAREGLADHGVAVDAVRLDLGAMMARKDRIVRELTGGVAALVEAAGVTRFTGRGALVAPDRVRFTPTSGEAIEIAASAVILATGSAPIALPFLPFDGERVVSSTEALTFDAVPARLAVIGAGAVGLELGSVWARLGAEVTVLERLPRLFPWTDLEVARALGRALKRQGLTLRLGCSVTGATREGDAVVLAYEDADGAATSLTVDRVLVAVGRRPYTEGLGLDAVAIELEHGRVPVDARWQTKAPGVYAIGDLIAGPMLAHKAEEEGIAVAERLAGRAGHVNYAAIPNVVYTAPEVASVGLTAEAASEPGRAVRTGQFRFAANGRARTLGATDGLVKVIADAKTDELLGVHICGPRASDLIAEITVALELGASAEDLARTCHAHPTLSEAVREAMLAVDGRALHQARPRNRRSTPESESAPA